MTELDQETKSWLSSLKINKTFSSINDFENGYNFGAIFDKLQLSRGKKFKNSSDMGCIFQNYKNVRDLLLQNFNYDFPVNNIIYRTDELLKVLREQTTKYLQQKKILQMKAATSVGSFGQKALIQPFQQKTFKNRQKQITLNASSFNQTSKMPKKIQDIEKKLDKFRQQKTRHQLVALQQRKQEIEQYRRVVMNTRDYQINKVKKTHDEVKQKQRKVHDVWFKTQQIKKQRIQTDKQFQSFQKSKKDKLAQSFRNNEIDHMNKGHQMFQLNCMRQGIQLQHDPDKPLKAEPEFNKVVVMQRIKDNIQKHQIQKKQRIKRENKKRIQGEEAKLQSQVLWTQLNKIEDYNKKMASHFQICQDTYKVEKRIEAQFQSRKQKCKNKKFVDLPAFQNQQQREEQFRKRQIQYLHNDVKYLQKKWQARKSVAQQIVEALLQTTIQSQQIFQQNQGFSYQQWKSLQKMFLNHQDNKKKNKKQDIKLYIDYSLFDRSLKQYVKDEGSWKNFDKNTNELNQSQQLTRAVSQIIKISYPDQSISQRKNLPLYMPLKVTFLGAKLTGKSTHTAKLAEKYGVIIINPKEIIKQAIQLARPPVQEDLKKASKKDSKKTQQLTAQKIALKQFGLKLLQNVTCLQQAKDNQFIDAIIWKLSQNFENKNQQQIYNLYKQAKQKQKVRHQQALKDFEQAQKKPKKDSKKSGNNQPSNQEPPKMNNCFFSIGFVLDDYQICDHSARLIERSLNNYISEQQRVNKKSVQAKQKLSLILKIPEPAKDYSLKQGFFDLVFSLNCNQQALLKRRSGRKVDPSSKIIYHPTFNPPPQVKGFAQKLLQLPAPDQDSVTKSVDRYRQEQQNVHKFYSAFGIQKEKIGVFSEIKQEQQTVQQTFQQISNKIQRMLISKYTIIQQSISNIQQNPKQSQQNQQKQINQQKMPLQQSQNAIKGSQPAQFNDICQLIRNKLKKQDSQMILQKYIEIVKKYEQEIKQCLYSLESQRSNFTKQLLAVQKKFTSLINRPDDKAGKILNFQQNYNKLLVERGNIVKDAEASKYIVQKLDQLYNSLWDAIGNKKNQAVQERTKFKQSNWLNNQCQKVVQILKTLIQIQLNYVCQTVFIILFINCSIQQKSSDYMTQYLSLGIDPKLQPLYSISNNKSSLVENQRFQYYLDQTQKCLLSLPGFIQQKFKKMKVVKISQIDRLMQDFISTSVRNIKNKCQSVSNKVQQRILQQRSYYQTLLNKMDDWIIQGIKAENDFVYQIFKNIKKYIQEAKKSNVKDLHVKQITETLLPIKQISLYPIPLRVQTKHRKIPVYSYMIFLQEIKTLSNSQGKVNFEIFTKYMNKRKKSQMLHSNVLKLDYDTAQQYLVKDGYLQLRQLAIAVIFWDVKVFDDEQLSLYKSKLLKKQRSIQQKQFKQKLLLSSKSSSAQIQQNKQSGKQGYRKRASVISAFPTQKQLSLQELVLMDGTFDQEEQYIMKHFIFQIFRQPDTDYVQAQRLLDTLSVFDELQVFRYGDTVMMLNI